MRRDAQRLREVGEPQGQVDEREALVEEGPPARLGAAVPPALRSVAELVRPGAHAGHLPELAVAEESVERLHVAAEPVVVGDVDLEVGAVRGGDDPLHAARGERERALAEHVHLGREGAQHVRLVQVVGRRDHHRVQLVELEQLLDVREGVGDAEAVRERPRLGAVVVAQRDELRAPHLGEHGQVRELRDGAGADDAETHRDLAHRAVVAPPGRSRYVPTARSEPKRAPLRRS